ncbi:MAG: coproporphyrinogen dehydrogenase HemZ [Clostridiales bacterium]|nr:coproporphyrinogen dehydrogenase HemZ [Clostridiales bacterium]
MRTLYTNFPYPTEIHDVVKLFLDDVELCNDVGDASISVVENIVQETVFNYVAMCNSCVEQQSIDVSGVNELQMIRLRKRYAKIATYNLLVKVCGKTMPWGSLTGIRPTKLADQLRREGLDWQETFTNVLGVSLSKTQLVADILHTQSGLRQHKDGCADLYVGIPFCVTRCSYCSFTSGELDRLKKYVEPYVVALCQDIKLTLRFAKEKGIHINNVYLGGGTPTSLTAKQLDEVMSCIDFDPVEFTVEAGRPDTIDEDKLKVFAKHGVHRISINPQTFNQSVLDVIGRKHTVKEIYDKYELAKRYCFTINMDLIAGLPTETYDMFCNSVDSAIVLAPDNITIHTLALKHGSALKEQNYAGAQDVSKMVEYSRSKLYEASYLPYYMYRQKYMSENLENVGYCKSGTHCLYNIGIMEEFSDILACGTNAISKRIISGENRIERSANAKDVITYIERNEDYLKKKFELFS